MPEYVYLRKPTCWYTFVLHSYILFCVLQMLTKKNVDDAMHFIYSHKYNTNSSEDSSDIMN